MSPLTDRQQQVYAFLTAYLAANGYPPTLQEIARHLAHLRQSRGAAPPQGAGARRPDYAQPRQLPFHHPGRPHRERAVVLPLVGTVRAGAAAVGDGGDRSTIRRRSSPWSSGNDSFLLRVKGDSMIEAHIVDGDLAVVRPQSTAENGEIVVALIDGEATLKRFFREGRLHPPATGKRRHGSR